MDIVDGQVHVGRGRIESTLAAMDALGIRSLVIDEFWGALGADDPTHIQPGFALPNGAWRALNPTAQEASLLHPDRFSYLVRVDRQDPDLPSLMRIIASEPAARAIRIQPVWTMEEARAFESGAYDELCSLAQKHALPIFVFIPGFVELMPRYLAKFPDTQFIIDHCGMPFPNIPPDRPAMQHERSSYFDAVLSIAKHRNVALKWAHIQNGFGVRESPYAEVLPFLRRAIDAFSAERILWASDHTVIPGHSWSQLLSYLRDTTELTCEEKQWILGGTARRLLRWPAPPENI